MGSTAAIAAATTATGQLPLRYQSGPPTAAHAVSDRPAICCGLIVKPDSYTNWANRWATVRCGLRSTIPSAANS